MIFATRRSSDLRSFALGRLGKLAPCNGHDARLSNGIARTYARGMLKALSRKLREGSHCREVLKRTRDLRAGKASMGDLVDAAMNFGGKGNIKIRTVQKRSEILRLARLPEGSYEEFVDDPKQIGYGISLVRVPE